MGEEARRKAEEEAGKSWLERAIDLAGKARQLEDQGEQRQALQQYQNCLEVFEIVKKREKSERIRDALQSKMQELNTRADRLSEAIDLAEAADAARILAAPMESAGVSEGSLPEDADAARAAEILAGSGEIALHHAAPPERI